MDSIVGMVKARRTSKVRDCKSRKGFIEIGEEINGTLSLLQVSYASGSPRRRIIGRTDNSGFAVGC